MLLQLMMPHQGWWGIISWRSISVERSREKSTVRRQKDSSSIAELSCSRRTVGGASSGASAEQSKAPPGTTWGIAVPITKNHPPEALTRLAAGVCRTAAVWPELAGKPSRPSRSRASIGLLQCCCNATAHQEPPPRNSACRGRLQDCNNAAGRSEPRTLNAAAACRRPASPGAPQTPSRPRDYARGRTNRTTQHPAWDGMGHSCA